MVIGDACLLLQLQKRDQNNVLTPKPGARYLDRTADLELTSSTNPRFGAKQILIQGGTVVEEVAFYYWQNFNKYE